MALPPSIAARDRHGISAVAISKEDQAQLSEASPLVGSGGYGGVAWRFD
jgi:hypothetical protein